MQGRETRDLAYPRRVGLGSVSHVGVDVGAAEPIVAITGRVFGRAAWFSATMGRSPKADRLRDEKGAAHGSCSGDRVYGWI